MRRALGSLLLLSLLLVPSGAFLKVSGNEIIAQGQPLTLRGFALENGIFSQWDDNKKQMVMITDSGLVSWSLTAADIPAIKNTGANTVRYCLNIERFAADNPLRLENLRIFEQHLEWCKRAGLYLIVNLHVPPGHTNVLRSREDSIFESGVYWQQFETFWTDFLQRYKNESSIAGWEFFNEPQIPPQMSEESWHLRVEKFINKMRALDENHIFFICYPHAKVVSRTADGDHEVDWSFLPFHKYTDPNIVYVLHFYEPLLFTHQGFADYFPAGVAYPLDSFQYKKYLASQESAYTKKTKQGWFYYESEPQYPPESADYGTPYLAAGQGAGAVYFDTVSIYEVAPHNTKTELVLPNPSFQPELPGYPALDGRYLYDPSLYLFWTTYYSDKYDPARQDDRNKPVYRLITSGGFDDRYCLLLNNPAQEVANWQTDPSQFRIKPKTGCRYQICGWAKAASPEAAHIGISWYQGTPVQYNKNKLAEFMQKNYLAFARKYNVPLMATEFGSIGIAQENYRARWTEDVLELFKKYEISYTYWCYSQKYGWGIDFGLYLKNPFDLEKEFYRYEKMIKVLKQSF